MARRKGLCRRVRGSVEMDEVIEQPTGLTRRRFVTKGTALAAGTALGVAALSGTAKAKGVTLPDAAKLAADGRRLVDYEALELASLYRSGATTSVAVTQ